MQVHVSNDAPTSVATGALVVPIFAGGTVDGVAAEVDKVLGGTLADIVASGEIGGKANETSLVHAKDSSFKRVLAVGLGEREKLTLSGLAKYAGTAVRYLGKRGVTTIAIALPAGVDAALAASFIAEGAVAWPQTLSLMAGMVCGGLAGAYVARVIPARVARGMIVLVGFFTWIALRREF